MFTLPGVLGVILTIYLRPQEIWPQLQAIPLLHLFLGLALFGLAVDLKLRLSAPATVPQMPFAIAFVAWQVLTLVVKGRGGAGIGAMVEIAIPFVLFAILAHGVQTFRALELVTKVLLVVVLFLAVVGVHQHYADKGCHARADIGGTGSIAQAKYDGRPCEQPRDCILNDPEPGTEYICEHVGLLGTSSVGGRVRWRGVLADPNELAFAIGIGLPFALVLLERRRSALRGWLAAISLGLIGLCVVHTQSRGGQLVLAAVLGTYFVRRYGWKGMLLAGMALAPVVLLGGRSGAEADQSSMERYEAWMEGIIMFKSSPLIGIGKGQYTDFHWLTAHNSYMLVAAETGIVGMWLWSAVLYLSAKVPFAALRRSAHWIAAGEPSHVARYWGTGLLASMLGLTVGIFFLSLTYHYVVWVYFGLAGALYAAIRTHDPEFKVRLGWLEALAILAADVLVLGMIFFLARRGA